MGSLETHPGSPHDAPAPPEGDQPSSRSRFNDLSNEIGTALNRGKETREYMRNQLFEKLDTTFANSRFNIIRRDENDSGTVGCRIYNQQNERLLTIFITANHQDQSYEICDGRDISFLQAFDIYPPEREKGKSERFYVREAAEKVAQAALEQAELIDAAIQKAKLDKKPEQK